MIIAVLSRSSSYEIESSYIKITQANDEITVMENHEKMIYAVQNGALTFDNNRRIEVKNAICLIENGKCRIFT